MWVATCPGCRRRRLYGAHQLREVWNLASGVIAVDLACACGEVVTLLTGRAVSERRPAVVTAPDARPPAASP